MGPKTENSIQAKVDPGAGGRRVRPSRPRPGVDDPAAAIGTALRQVFPHAGDSSAFADVLAALDRLPGVTDAAAVTRDTGGPTRATDQPRPASGKAVAAKRGPSPVSASPRLVPHRACSLR